MHNVYSYSYMPTKKKNTNKLINEINEKLPWQKGSKIKEKCKIPV